MKKLFIYYMVRFFLIAILRVKQVLTKQGNTYSYETDQLLPFKLYCKNNISYSIKPEIEPILCPNSIPSNKTLCSRFHNTNISIDQHPSYSNTKYYWQNIFHQLQKHIGNKKIYFVGDSLTWQIIDQMKCLEAFSNVQIMNHIQGSAQVYPTQLDSLIYNFSYNTNVVDTAYKHLWYNQIKNSNHTIKYLVINTGYWWNPVMFKYIQNNSKIQDTNVDVMLDIYREYFRMDGIFISKLHNLILNYNVTILWRDTTPAGDCTNMSDTYPYHYVLHTMNLIAHEALKKIGVIIIPNIWKESLPYWKLHIGQTIDHMDVVHYCNFQNQSVTNIWIKNTIQCILDN